MGDAELDALLVVDPANIHYLCGYNAWSFYTPQAMLVTPDQQPLLVMRAMDAQGAHRTVFPDTAEVDGYAESYVHRVDRHPFDAIAERFREAGHGRRMRVGVEGDAHFFAVRGYLALAKALPEWELIESHELVNWVRVVKSDAEIELMRAAGRVSSHVMATAVDAIEAGLPQPELMATIQSAQALGTGDTAGDYPAIVPLMMAGDAVDTPHLTYSNTRFNEEAVSLELVGVHKRYHAPLARTVSLSPPSQELERLAEVTAEGLNLVIDGMRPGMSVADAHGLWQRHISAAGFEKDSRLGYSIGLGYPPDWGERTVSIRGDDHTVLEPGMCFHLIAGMWLSSTGCEISESVTVTASGVEVLTDAPRELIVKG
ncbi:MAG TPA: M24 family metallopeptidase [Candidatus Agrococcus pullicola]|uniref:M24 family metallopeptidase n=1 Tax=Candidatus Agrococcus pullicola TaxID=2838429 RepID=A0A9D1YVN6_9MICO|nr:M24 family metallopeptidase [Candidatus Agrococcus pullicola]